MSREETLERVVSAVVRANHGVEPGAIREDASLVTDLGMDSMRLATLIAELKAQFGNVEMTSWFISAARHGSDTVGGLVDYLHKAAQRKAG